MQCACGDMVTANAKNDKAAVGALMKAGMKHFDTCPKADMFKNMSQDDMINMVKSSMQKVG